MLITCGGSDPHGISLLILGEIARLKSSFEFIRVIIGPSFSKLHIDQIFHVCAENEIEYVISPSHMVDHYLWADIVLCGSSTSRYEAVACGTPVAFTSIYMSHLQSSKEFHESGLASHLGSYAEEGAVAIVKKLIEGCFDQQYYKKCITNIYQWHFDRANSQSIANRLIEALNV